LKRATARVNETQHTVQARVKEARATVPAVDAAFKAMERDRRVAGNLLACAVAYRLFLWILPLALLVAGVLGLLHAAHPGTAGDVAGDLGMGAYITSTVASASDQASKTWWLLLGIALFAFYSASSGGAKTMRAVQALAWGGLPDKPQKAWKPPLGFAGFALGVIVIVLFENWLRAQSSALGLGARLGMIGVFFAYALLMLLCLPHSTAPWPALIPGAALLAMGTQILHLVTVLYLAGRLESSSELYGGLGAAATILLWLYLLGRLFVGAGALNAALWERYVERSGSRSLPT
jgi:uncharacterized BrkB/YihY/UPF0761 family membrane protein